MFGATYFGYSAYGSTPLLDLLVGAILASETDSIAIALSDMTIAMSNDTTIAMSQDGGN